MQKHKEEVLAYAKDLEDQIPLNKISSATKRHFTAQNLHPNTVSNYLEDHPKYFNKSKVRKIKRTVSLKSWIIKNIKSLNDDDPKLGQIAQEISEPFHMVK